MNEQTKHRIDDDIVAYLLSYPRSGNSWTRYIIEYITGIITIYDGHLRQSCGHRAIEGHRGGPHTDHTVTTLTAAAFEEMGTLKLHNIDYPVSSQPAIPWRNQRINYNKGLILKKHFGPEVDATIQWMTPDRVVEAWNNKTLLTGPKLILLLRDPRDCTIRHYGSLSDHSWNQYIGNIYYYNDYEYPKKIIYYEELLRDPRLTIEDLGKFILGDEGANIDNIINEFVDEYDRHVELSASLYRSYGDASYQTRTLNKPNCGINHHHLNAPLADLRNRKLINECHKDPLLAQILAPYVDETFAAPRTTKT